MNRRGHPRGVKPIATARCPKGHDVADVCPTAAGLEIYITDVPFERAQPGQKMTTSRLIKMLAALDGTEPYVGIVVGTCLRCRRRCQTTTEAVLANARLRQDTRMEWLGES